MSEGVPEQASGAVSIVRQYESSELRLRLRGLEFEGTIRLHLEHRSGAALLVPSCLRVRTVGGHELSTRGFDGTDYIFSVLEATHEVHILASAPSVILGGQTKALLRRGTDITLAKSGSLRITGDEDTMPIVLNKT